MSVVEIISGTPGQSFAMADWQTQPQAALESKNVSWEALCLCWAGQPLLPLLGWIALELGWTALVIIVGLESP